MLYQDLLIPLEMGTESEESLQQAVYLGAGDKTELVKEDRRGESGDLNLTYLLPLLSHLLQALLVGKQNEWGKSLRRISRERGRSGVGGCNRRPTEMAVRQGDWIWRRWASLAGVARVFPGNLLQLGAGDKTMNGGEEFGGERLCGVGREAAVSVLQS